MRASFLGLVLVAGWLAGCATGAGPERGWDAVGRIPPGRYVVQTWEPVGGRTTPIFVILLTKAGDRPARIFEPYGVTAQGEVTDLAEVVAGYKQRYPALLPGDVEVQPVTADGTTIGSVIRTRGIDVYTYHDRATGDYSVRLSGFGKWPKRGGGGPGSAGGK